MAAPLAVRPISTTPRSGVLAPGHLVRALRDEQTVLEELVATLERQRRAVATDDIDTVNDTVFAAHRLLGAYREARARRKSAVIVACGGGEGSVEDLPQALGDQLTEGERRAADELRSAARRLVSAVDQNRRLLQSAMSSGDQLFKLLTGAGAGAVPQSYAPANRAAPTAPTGPRLMDLRG